MSDQKEVDITKDFDTNRDIRQKELQNLQDILYDGEKINLDLNTVDLVKCLIHILNYNRLAEDLMISTLGDIFKVIQAVAQGEMNVFTLRTHMKALIRGLENNKLIDQNELIKIHDNEIIGEELKKMKDQYKLVNLDGIDRGIEKDGK